MVADVVTEADVVADVEEAANAALDGSLQCRR
jgi:hypothetical protein